jgi:hypothetical protein
VRARRIGAPYGFVVEVRARAYELWKAEPASTAIGLRKHRIPSDLRS